MKDAECVAFLQATLPALGMRWAGFRKVRKLVCKRVSRRLRKLDLKDVQAYRDYLEHQPAEWRTLDALCCIPVSRFWRDAIVFESLEQEVLPTLAAGAASRSRSDLSCWSACCAGGEEAYSVGLLWHYRLLQRFPQLDLHVVATDVDESQLERARRGCYFASSLKSVPRDIRASAFTRCGDQLCLRDEFRTVDFLQQDIREAWPQGEFDLILCRNAVLTYFAPAMQHSVIERIIARLHPGGALIVGIHEAPPPHLMGLAPWPGGRGIYRKTGSIAK